MMTFRIRRSWLVFGGGVASLVTLTCFAGMTLRPAKSDTPPAPAYADVQAIFTANCAQCHNDTRHSHGLDLATYASLMKGAKDGPVIVAGHPEQSTLVLVINGTKTPQMPRNKPPLAQKDIDTITNWVKAGAAD